MQHAASCRSGFRCASSCCLRAVSVGRNIDGRVNVLKQRDTCRSRCLVESQAPVVASPQERPQCSV